MTTAIDSVLKRFWDRGLPDIFGVPRDGASPVNDAIRQSVEHRSGRSRARFNAHRSRQETLTCLALF